MVAKVSKDNINPLVLDGNDVKFRLLAERSHTNTPVHVDWIRFTCLLRNVAPSFQTAPVDTFPPFSAQWGRRELFDTVPAKIQHEMLRSYIEGFAKDHADPAFQWPMQQALDLAKQICDALGPDFKINPELKKGQDFYKYRWSITRNETECAWVGFLAAGESPSKKSQDSTIHANIHGTATTFAVPGWNERLANVVDSHDGKITRADLALDFFNGIDGGLDQIKAEYETGLCNSNGRRLKFSLAGDWSNDPNDGRSLYFGSRESGKITNAYEKGHQLFGFKAGSNWVRVELRYGNKFRVLSSDILRRPADFFAGASEWHALTLAKADAIVTPEPVSCNARLPQETVKAEVHRNVSWAWTVAGPTIAAAFRYLDNEQFLELVNWETKKLPGRLRKFSPSELGKAFAASMGQFSSGGGFSSSLVAA